MAHLPWESWAGPLPGFTVPEQGSFFSRQVFMPRGGISAYFDLTNSFLSRQQFFPTLADEVGPIIQGQRRQFFWTDDAAQAIEGQVFGRRYFDQSLLRIGLTGVILADGSVPFTGDQSMGSHKLTNVTDPTSNQDAATKAYVDSVAAGFDPVQAAVFGPHERPDIAYTSQANTFLTTQTIRTEGLTYEVKIINPTTATAGSTVQVPFGTLAQGSVWDTNDLVARDVYYTTAFTATSGDVPVATLTLGVVAGAASGALSIDSTGTTTIGTLSVGSVTASGDVSAATFTGNGSGLTNLEAGGISSGTLVPARGGTGVSNNNSSTITISGSFALTLTLTAATGVTLPTTGTLATLAGSESLTNKKLGSLTSNGYVKTSGGDGTLSVDTSTFRVQLTAARTYYVRTDGSDSNDGLANTAGGAFLTIQKAIDVASALDNGGFDITIQVADGTYTGANTLKSFVGSGKITIQGNSGTPANVVVSVTSGQGFSATAVAGTYYIKDLKISTTTSGDCIFATGTPTYIQIGNLDFGAVASNHIECTFGAYVDCQSSYAITGGTGAGGSHWVCNNARIRRFSGMTITLTGTPNFAGQFCLSQNTGNVNARNITFSGAATGTRYTANMNGVIDVGGGGASYLPGNAAGSTATGGQYA